MPSPPLSGPPRWLFPPVLPPPPLSAYPEVRVPPGDSDPTADCCPKRRDACLPRATSCEDAYTPTGLDLRTWSRSQPLGFLQRNTSPPAHNAWIRAAAYAAKHADRFVTSGRGNASSEKRKMVPRKDMKRAPEEKMIKRERYRRLKEAPEVLDPGIGEFMVGNEGQRAPDTQQRDTGRIRTPLGHKDVGRYSRQATRRVYLAAYLSSSCLPTRLSPRRRRDVSSHQKRGRKRKEKTRAGAKAARHPNKLRFLYER